MAALVTLAADAAVNPRLLESELPPLDNTSKSALNLNSTQGDGVGGSLLTPIELYDLGTLTQLLKSCVKVFCSSVRPSFISPWTNQPPTECTGSAFILDLEKRLVVTNAHVVQFARTIRLRREGSPDKYEASLLTISHQSDLAILTVSSDAFWSGSEIRAVTMGDRVPMMQQSCDVIGFPVGGDSVCITTGVVSRIDWSSYAQSTECNLLIQVDAAINAGNSGGPAFSEGKLVGVAFQASAVATADNIGYIIPITVLRRVLEDFYCECEKIGIVDVNDGKWSKPGSSTPHLSPNVPLVKLKGFGRFTAVSQTAESPHLRTSLLLPAGESGIVVRKVPKVSLLNGLLEDEDVLTQIDTYSISNDGRVCIPGLQTLDFRVVVSTKLVGENVNLTFYRRGERHQVTTVVENPPGFYKEIDKSLRFSYVMFAGCVFSTLPFTDCGKGWEGLSPFVEGCAIQAGRRYEDPAQQLVIMSQFLPHSVSVGYSRKDGFHSRHSWEPQPLLSVNGQDVHNLEDVARVIAKASDANAAGEEAAVTFMSFAFAHGVKIVLPLALGLEASKELKRDFGMTSAISDDVAAAIGPELAAKFL